MNSMLDASCVRGVSCAPICSKLGRGSCGMVCILTSVLFVPHGYIDVSVCTKKCVGSKFARTVVSLLRV